MEKLIDSKELAERLNCTTWQVWTLARQGRIPYLRVGERMMRFDAEKVMKVLERNGGSHEK